MSRRHLTKEERRQIFERAKGRCEYCQCWSQYSAKSFEFEHIFPVAKGGREHLENLAFACGGCNAHKYDKTSALDPLDGAEVPLFNPRKQKWKEHFEWSEDAVQIIGITPIGRATVDALKMNRPGLVNLRKLFIKEGIQPPDPF